MLTCAYASFVSCNYRNVILSWGGGGGEGWSMLKQKEVDNDMLKKYAYLISARLCKEELNMENHFKNC